MDEQLLNGQCDLSHAEPDVTLEKSRPNSRKRSAADPAKDGQRKPVPKLSEVDFLLSLWQSDCAELKQAGVQLRLTAETDESGKPCIHLVLVETNFCQTCGMFHSTKQAHTCTR